MRSAFSPDRTQTTVGDISHRRPVPAVTWSGWGVIVRSKPMIGRKRNDGHSRAVMTEEPRPGELSMAQKIRVALAATLVIVVLFLAIPYTRLSSSAATAER